MSTSSLLVRKVDDAIVVELHVARRVMAGAPKRSTARFLPRRCLCRGAKFARRGARLVMPDVGRDEDFARVQDERATCLVDTVIGEARKGVPGLDPGAPS